MYQNYIKENAERKKIGLNPKPISNASLLKDIIKEIQNENSSC